VTVARSPCQRVGTELVDIWYDVSDADGDELDVSVEVKVSGRVIPASSFSGDIGSGVMPGNNRHIVWDAGADWDGRVSDQVSFVITADDGTSGPTPPGFVWVEGGTFTMGDTCRALCTPYGWRVTQAGVEEHAWCGTITVLYTVPHRLLRTATTTPRSTPSRNLGLGRLLWTTCSTNLRRRYPLTTSEWTNVGLLRRLVPSWR